MRKQLVDLRKVMAEHHIDAYLIPTTDFHGSEYVNDYFKCRKFISGFTGSAGTLLVTTNDAFLWTDGRYFLQAASQLAGTGIQLMKMNQPDVPTILDYLNQHLSSGETLGFDGRVINGSFFRQLEKTLLPKGINLSVTEDLVDQIWTDRPTITPSTIYPLPLEVTGEDSASKLARLQQQMRASKAHYHLITKMEEIAWLFNLRGDDVENTPVFFSYALVTQDCASLYVMDLSLQNRWLFPNVEIKPYHDIFDDLRDLNPSASIWLDEDLVNAALIDALPASMSIINKPSPILLMKAIKHPMEISSTRNAHIKDGVAMVNFIYWLKHNIGVLPLTEISAADYLESCRRKQRGFNDLSFETISGYGPNGAIIHYFATAESNLPLEPSGFLLVDSGGQYNDGTTDITRTIALGPLTEGMKRHYTAVLRCHIALASTVFPKGTTGLTLDQLTRKPLQHLGLDYQHGTGHGVGHMLSVHEGPNTISPSGGNCTIVPGMITSNEPGVYLEGKYGIRLENELLCVEAGEQHGAGDFAFESITLCPFDAQAILLEDLTAKEKAYLNTYHQQVYAVLSPYLTEEVNTWLMAETQPI
ncbi:Xaa-Pro aminopeptidase [Clostridiales Family XIII bacterium PM5-7]